MYVIVCYDVVKDARRNQLFKGLKGYLRPVQYSVFEGQLPDRRWAALLGLVDHVIDPKVDSVRLYQLCRGCRGIVTLRGTSPKMLDPNEPVIV